MQIGHFTKTENGTFSGTLETLMLARDIDFIPAKTSENDKAPDYRIVTADSGLEIGAGWNHIAKSTDKPYIKVKLDDPSFANTIWAALTAQDEGGFQLLWSRPNGKSSEGKANKETL
ncbi:MAG: DUF736 domain-containing protein [Pseudomonadota bacterium]